MSDLKPCPFCGGEASCVWMPYIGGGGYGHVAECDDCWAKSGFYSTEAEAIAAWNTRAERGTLTAEQVRKAIERNFGKVAVLDDGGPVEWRDDWVCNIGINYKAIADELNTRAERTCKDANTRFNAWTCSECKCTLLLMFDDYGEPTLNVDGVASVPNYCPNCGARIEAGDA